MRKFLPYIIIVITIISSFTTVNRVEATVCTSPNVPAGCTSTTTSPTSYHLLTPLPCDPATPGCNSSGQLTDFDPGAGSFSSYLNIMIRIFIGICAVLAVVMIVVGGVEYMTSELSHTKEAGKERIEHAVLGLLIALGAYAILFTINPDLLISDITLKNTDPAAIQRTNNGPLGNCVYLLDSRTVNTQATEIDCRAVARFQSWTPTSTGGASGSY